MTTTGTGTTGANSTSGTANSTAGSAMTTSATMSASTGAGGASTSGSTGASSGATGGSGGAYVLPAVPDYLNIVPPGQDGVVNATELLGVEGGTFPPHVIDQLAMYHGLVKATPGLTEDKLLQYYKDATLGGGSAPIERTYSPTTGVVVTRDSAFGVPHIVGQTRYATMFAAGYTGAEDRLFLMDVLRHVGRARVSELLGASDSNQALDRAQLAVAPYQEADLTAQVQALGSDAEGQGVVADLQAYTDGVNQYIQEALLDVTKLPADYAAIQQIPATWKVEDAVAIGSLVGAQLGRGGGNELANACGLSKLKSTLGSATAARAVFDDFHFAEDAEAPVTSPDAAPYMAKPANVSASAHPDIDCASLKAIGGGSILGGIGGLGGLFPIAMSNAMLVSASHTKSGHPIAVFGPQTGYFMPQLLVEKDIQGPGIHARGVSFAGTDVWVELGHGDGYAWSATSSDADNTDEFVLELCEPGIGIPTVNSMGYKVGNTCKPIETFQHTQIAKPSAGGIGTTILLDWRVERTADYGGIVARGTTKAGKPIAIASLRSTYGRELASAKGFRRLSDPSYVTSYDTFRTAISAIEYSFNWFYIDANDIGYEHSCRCPKRSSAVDPYLPAWGNGSYDWTGFLDLSEQPFTKNPSQGYIVSWNNKQAPGFRANDANFSYGPTYRSEMLEKRIKSAISTGLVHRGEVVDAMEEAATVDLRGQEVLPFALQIMGASAPSGADPRAQEMRDRLVAWVQGGAHRRDHDGDGAYDDAVAPAIIDAWWPRMCHAALDASSGGAIDALGIEIDDHERLAHTGSAFQNGLYSHLKKDFRQILGVAVASPWSKMYCGGGDPALCGAALWSSLSQAAADLQTEFTSANVSDWKRAMTYEDVEYSALGVVKVPAQPWINRPTFQQVVQINGWLPAP